MSDWTGDDNPARQQMFAHWREVEQEYGEPIREVLLGFRQLECSWRTIAGALGISEPALRRWRDALRIEDDRVFRDVPQVYKAERAARRLGYRSASDAVVSLRTTGHTIEATATKLGISKSAVKYHYPSGFGGTVFVLTKKAREARRRNMKEALRAAIAARRT